MLKLTLNDPHDAKPDPNRPSRRIFIHESKCENFNDMQHANYWNLCLTTKVAVILILNTLTNRNE